MTFTYQDMGRPFHEYILHISIMAGWIAEMLFMPFFACIAVKRTEHCWVRSVLASVCSNS